MSYRNYLLIVNKKKLNSIKNITKEELRNEFFSDWDREHCEEDELPYLGNITDGIGAEEVLEINCTNEMYKRLKKCMKPIFKDKEIQKHYSEDTEFFKLKPEALNVIHEEYYLKTKEYYEHLCDENYKEAFNPNRTHYERLVNHVKHQLASLQDVNRLSQNKNILVYSWLYEYDLFNLLHVMRVFNPKKQALLWTGH